MSVTAAGGPGVVVSTNATSNAPVDPGVAIDTPGLRPGSRRTSVSASSGGATDTATRTMLPSGGTGPARRSHPPVTAGSSSEQGIP